jgi:hypothetical protein
MSVGFQILKPKMLELVDDGWGQRHEVCNHELSGGNSLSMASKIMSATRLSALFACYRLLWKTGLQCFHFSLPRGMMQSSKRVAFKCQFLRSVFWQSIDCEKCHWRCRSIREGKNLLSVCNKIALQINCKLGGELWRLEVTRTCVPFHFADASGKDHVNRNRCLSWQHQQGVGKLQTWLS